MPSQEGLEASQDQTRNCATKLLRIDPITTAQGMGNAVVSSRIYVERGTRKTSAFESLRTRGLISVQCPSSPRTAAAFVARQSGHIAMRENLECKCFL